MEIRNFAFNKALLKSYHSNKKCTSVGNLSVGGTGKTPCSIFLLNHLLEQGYKPAFVSRGYGRHSKGLQEVSLDQDPSFFGDEPYLVKQKFPTIPVLVAEKRVEAVKELEKNFEIDVIILDDAYQHRYIRRDFNIMLSRFDYPFFYDQVIPGGRLREFRKQAKRADLILFTKCPEELSEEEMAYYNLECRNYADAPVGFSYVQQEGIESWDGEKLDIKQQKAALITGIAQPNLLVEYAHHNFDLKEHFEYTDHHEFSFDEVQSWISFLKEERLDFLLITEKDAARLKDVVRETERKYFVKLPMRIKFSEDTEAHLKLMLKELME